MGEASRDRNLSNINSDITNKNFSKPEKSNLPLLMTDSNYWDELSDYSNWKSLDDIIRAVRQKFTVEKATSLFIDMEHPFKLGKPRLNYLRVGHYILENYVLVITPILSRDTDKTIIWWYNPERGIWCPNARQILKILSHHILNKIRTTRAINEIIQIIESETTTYIDFNSDPYLVAVQNGVLNLQTKKLLPFDPRYFLTNSLAPIYDPKADCPLFKKFLSEILPKDAIIIVQELLGDILLKDYRFQKIFFFYGEGGNGKGTLVRVIKSFLGSGNYALEHFQDLQEKEFSKAELFGKHVNLAGDMGARAFKDTNILKQLRGQEPMSARFIYGPPFEFTNYAILLGNMNKLPEVEDTTKSWERSLMLIEFCNCFDDSENRDPVLIEKLTSKAELSGILNFALEGLDRLLQNGGYSMFKTGTEMIERYTRLNNPFKAFSLDIVGLGEYNGNWRESDWIGDPELFQSFKEYCAEHGYEIPSKTECTQRLQSIFPTVRRTRVRRGPILQSGSNKGKRKPLMTWLGLKYQDDGDNWYRGVEGVQVPYDLFRIAWTRIIEKRPSCCEKGITLSQIKSELSFLTKAELETDLQICLKQSQVFKPREGYYKPTNPIEEL